MGLVGGGLLGLFYSLFSSSSLFVWPVVVSRDGVVLDGWARVEAARSRGISEVPALVVDVSCLRPTPREAAMCVELLIQANLGRSTAAGLRLAEAIHAAFSKKRDEFSRAVAAAAAKYVERGTYASLARAAPRIEAAAVEAMSAVACCDAQTRLFESHLRRLLATARTPMEALERVVEALAYSCASRRQRAHVLEAVRRVVAEETRVEVKTNPPVNADRRLVAEGCAEVLSAAAGIPRDEALRLFEEARAAASTLGTGDATIVAALYMALRGATATAAAEKFRTSHHPVKKLYEELVKRGVVKTGR